MSQQFVWRWFTISILCNIYTVVNSQNVTTCSAINSYVRVAAPSTIAKTLLSSQALFPPYTYNVEPTELVVLDSTIDGGICSGDIRTNITNKIVLIAPVHGECSYVEKVIAAQSKQARAVLLGNDVDAISVSPVPYSEVRDNETNLIYPSIPARMISYYDAHELAVAAWSDTVMIEFGCSEQVNVSEVLCVVDTSGDHWWLDGEYQLQSSVLHNGHAVWKLTGYLFVSVDLYVFLHDADGLDDWFWAISMDESMADDDYIAAKCVQRNVADPTQCTRWQTTDYFLFGTDTFSNNSGIVVNDSFCARTDNRLCVQSTQSALAGLHGTYVQIHVNTSAWLREWTECDTQPAIMQYRYYPGDDVAYFQLVDVYDLWVVAECRLLGYSVDELSAEHGGDAVRFHPELCTEWTSLVDGSLDAAHKIYDETLTVATDACEDDSCALATDYVAPDHLCLSRNSIMHTFLEGTYEQTGVVGTKYDTVEYVKSDALIVDDGDPVPIYIFFWGEVEDLAWWVIASTNLSYALEHDGEKTGVFGYCSASTVSPSQCFSCWNFWFSTSGHTEHGAWHADCSFDIAEAETATECEAATPELIPNEQWPEYICIRDSVSSEYDGVVDMSLLIGAYEVTWDDVTVDSVPYYVKPPNDFNSNNSYIYYSPFYGFWYIDGSATDGEDDTNSLLCRKEGVDDYLPTECTFWYDTHSNNIGSAFIYSDGCSAEDILRPTAVTSNEQKNENDLEDVMWIVSGVLVLSAICVCVYCLYTRRRNRHERVSTAGDGDIAGGEIELDEEVDKQGLVAENQKNIKGGMDMRPLHTFSTIKGNDDDDDLGETDEDGDEDDVSNDKPRRDILDDGDQNDKVSLFADKAANAQYLD